LLWLSGPEKFPGLSRNGPLAQHMLNIFPLIPGKQVKHVKNVYMSQGELEVSSCEEVYESSLASGMGKGVVVRGGGGLVWRVHPLPESPETTLTMQTGP